MSTKTATKEAARIDKDNQAVQLRRQGLTYDQIGKTIGLSAAGAFAAVTRAQNRIIRDDVEQLRKIENDRLDTIQQALWPQVLEGDNPSITNALRLLERRSKLNGLDMPVKIQAEVVSYDASSVEARLAQIIAVSSASATTDNTSQGRVTERVENG